MKCDNSLPPLASDDFYLKRETLPFKQSSTQTSLDILSFLELNQLQAWNGGFFSIQLPNHSVDTLWLPPKMYDGQIFRMVGLGRSLNDKKGDLLIQIQVVLKHLSPEECRHSNNNINIGLNKNTTQKSWWHFFK